jgi:pyruvate/2-oxoglutarate dehydrogenase complex dihydrolipoamide acyltransferase (E2) component
VVTKVLIPKVGMGTAEGTIAKWLKSEGDFVREGEVIVEIEMAKAVEEVPAPVTGVLRKIFLADGGTADVYTEIAEIEEKSGER